MKAFKQAFGLLQKIGKAVMLPVSVLPAAGILRFGGIPEWRSAAEIEPPPR